MNVSPSVNLERQSSLPLLGLVAPMILTQIAAFAAYFLGTSIGWVGETASLIVIISAVALLLLNPRRVAAVSWSLLATLAVFHLDTLHPETQAFIEFVAPLGALLLFPAVLTLSAYADTRATKAACIFLISFAAIQAIGFALNGFGLLTSRLGRDQYEGMLFGLGSYNAVLIVVCAVLVLVYKAGSRSIRIAGLIGLLSLAYWTESKISYLLIGSSVLGWSLAQVFTAGITRSFKQKVYYAIGGSVALLFGVGLALTGPSQFNNPSYFLTTANVALKGTPPTGFSTQEREKESTESGLNISQAGVNRSLTASVTTYSGKQQVVQGLAAREILRSPEQVLFGRGPGRGTSKFALDTLLYSGQARPGGLALLNARGSIATGPTSTALHVLTERGLFGCSLYLASTLLLLRMIWRRGSAWQSSLLMIAPATIVLFSFTSLLETPITTVTVGLALLSLVQVNPGSVSQLSISRAPRNL